MSEFHDALVIQSCVQKSRSAYLFLFVTKQIHGWIFYSAKETNTPIEATIEKKFIKQCY